MIALNPQTLRLASHAASALIGVVPKAKLAQLGLTRTPFLALAPLSAAALGGVVVAAFAIPQSRNWIFGQADRVMKSVRETLSEKKEEDSEGVPSRATDGAVVAASDVN